MYNTRLHVYNMRLYIYDIVQNEATYHVQHEASTYNTGLHTYNMRLHSYNIRH